MQNQSLRQAAAPTAACPLPTLRAQLTALTFHSPHLSEAEKLRANHHIHECEDAKRLTHWLQTVQAELARRNIVAQTKKTLAKYASPTRYHPRPPRHTPTVSTLAAYYVLDRTAAPHDRHAAAQFQPAHSLTYAQLLSR